MFIEETPEEQEARQRYQQQIEKLTRELAALEEKRQRLYIPSSLTLIDSQIQEVEEERQRADAAELARVAAL